MFDQLAFATPFSPTRLLTGKRLDSSPHLCKRRLAPVASVVSPISSPLYITIDPFTHSDGSDLLPSRKKRVVSPVVVIPGYGATAGAYKTFRESLLKSLPPGTDVTVVPLTLWSWAATFGGRPVTSVLRMVESTVQSALARTGASHVTLVGHSAGGWIARLYLGDSPYPDIVKGKAWQGRTHVHQLLCLGTPHASGEPVTKRNMSFVNTQYPGAFYDTVEYLNFAGDAVALPTAADDIPHWSQFWHPLWMPRLSYFLTDPLAQDEYAYIGDGKLRNSNVLYERQLKVLKS